MSDLPAFLGPILEDLASLRSSPGRRLRALTALDGLLATLCIPKDAESPAEGRERHRVLAVFLALQQEPEANVLARLLPLLARLLDSIHAQLVQTASSETIRPLVNEAHKTLQVIQGLALIHPHSREAVGRRSSVEVVIDLFLLTRHLPADPSALDASSSSPDQEHPSLAATLLDTLFCALADSPANLRVFEDAGGLEAVMKVLKTKGVRKDVRVKCLEFLFFYLLPERDETLRPAASSSASTPLPSASASSHQRDSSLGRAQGTPLVVSSPADEDTAASSTRPSRRLSLVGGDRLPSGQSQSRASLGLGISTSGVGVSSSRASSDELASAASSHYEPESAIPPSSPARRRFPVSPSASRTPSKHQAHGLGISHSHPPPVSSVPLGPSRAISLCATPSSSSSSSSSSAPASRPLRPLAPGINAGVPRLESFVPETPKHRPEKTPARSDRTPSRHRLQGDDDEPGSSDPARKMLFATPSSIAASDEELNHRRRTSGLMLPPPVPSSSSAGRSTSGSSSSTSSSARSLKQQTSTPTFRLQPSLTPSSSEDRQRNPSSTSSSGLQPSPLLPIVATSPALSAASSTGPQLSPNPSPTRPLHLTPSKPTKVDELSVSTASPRRPARPPLVSLTSTRSVEEKKELLGQYMGNVGSLMSALDGSGFATGRWEGLALGTR